MLIGVRYTVPNYPVGRRIIKFVWSINSVPHIVRKIKLKLEEYRYKKLLTERILAVMIILSGKFLLLI